MKRFTTLAQFRTLKYYWLNHKPFSAEDLLREGIYHIPALCRLSLRLMESRKQLMGFEAGDGTSRYFATTESRCEWEEIWNRGTSLLWMMCDRTLLLRGLNRYEKQALIAELEEILR